MATACSCAEPPIAIQRLTWWLFPATAFHAIYPATGPREGSSFPDRDFRGVWQKPGSFCTRRNRSRIAYPAGDVRCLKPGRGRTIKTHAPRSYTPSRRYSDARQILEGGNLKATRKTEGKREQTAKSRQGPG